MTLIIVDSGGANLNSILIAFNRLNVKAKVSGEKSVIKNAGKIILPGVGAAKDAMRRLEKLDLIDTIRQLTQPVLGICLGMQLLYESSKEGNVDCLGVIPGKIERLPDNQQLTIPHMGWNTVTIVQHTPLLNHIEDDDYVYFVHSYCAPLSDYSCAVTNYGKTFTAVVKKNNFYGAQFHPERSSKVGLQLLKNFLDF